MAYAYSDNQERNRIVQDVRRVVIKVGTRLLTDIDGVSEAERVQQLVDEVALLRDRGLSPILVSSGAIGAGMTVLGTPARPTSLASLQAHAAVGQSRLMYLYETACVRHGFHCAQLLLTAGDVKNRGRHLNVTCCLDALLSKGLLPVINENDSVSVDEIRFGDNDVLAALVANMIRADLTLLLTTIDGMHEVNSDGKLGSRISLVDSLTPKLRNMASGTDSNRFSVGGMVTKLKAAELVTKAGENLWIADGRDFGNIRRVFNGEDVGTLFVSGQKGHMKAKKRYLAFFSKDHGNIIVDPGAETALCQRGKSLLPSGIMAVEGNFKRGETVRILNKDNEEIARGVANFSSDDVNLIKGRQTHELKGLLGYEAYDSVVHRNYMVLTR